MIPKSGYRFSEKMWVPVFGKDHAPAKERIHCMSMRTPLSRVRGLGSAGTGTDHFWAQRVTSVAGIPLTVGFLVIVAILVGRSHAATVQILGSPIVALTM